MSLRYQFVKARGPASSIISLFGGGTETLGYSHVDILDRDQHSLIGARSDWIKTDQGWIPPGVQRRPLGYAEKTWVRRDVYELYASPAQEEIFYDYLYKQINKPYDQLAILAFLAGRNWRDDSAWFCDELAAAVTEKSGRCDELYLPANKLSPTTWAVVVSAIGGVRQ